MRPIALLALLLLSIVPTFAQAQITLQGVVLDEATRERIPYATILVEGSAFPKNLGVLSGEDGTFSLNLSPSDNVTITVSCVGYVTKKWIEKSTAGLQPRYEVLLKQDAETLAGVEVVGRKQLINLKSNGLTYNLSEDKLAQGTNLLNALKRVPLVNVDPNDNIMVKGTRNFSIYLDGRPYRIASVNPKAALQSIPS